ncbi:hypothetical protein [Janthinobacterium sp. PSPC3-1]|uniref:hypothetical protein n=1 Tax=Janthinobacterium sp. PSPC3-1 TaxID=2804653 RepID=UPI003CF5ED4B
MRTLLSSLLRFLGRHLLQFLLFVALLATGHVLLEQARQLKADQVRLDTMRGAERQTGAARQTLVLAGQARINGLRRASDDAILARLARIDLDLRQAPPSFSFGLALSDTAGLGNAIAGQAERRIEIELLKQERAYLQTLRAALGAENARQALGRLHREHHRAYRQLMDNLARQERLRQAHPLRVHLPGSAEQAAMAALQTDETGLRAANLDAYRRHAAQQARVLALPAGTTPGPFQPDQQGLDAALQDLAGEIARLDGKLSNNIWRAARQLLSDYGPTASLLVLSAILTPLAIKAFFYFVLAPLASRLKPLAIAPGLRPGAASVPPPPAGQPRISGVSLALPLHPGDTMVIHPAYLQSSPIGTRKRTQWLLDWSYPFTSLAAGMAALTRITSTQPASVTLSASDDPLMEVAVLTLPEGAALVLQPRALVGLVFHGARQPAISSHWRLASLHAWLTLQLRFIVFRGPVTLIVHGTRGVRMEPAGQGRSISQAATLGFSTGVLYSTTRSETFIPYLRGQQALLNDRFDGDGIYLYEETPRHGKQPGKVGSWFEGFTDAILKVLGI